MVGKIGRPCNYTEELADRICGLICEGKSERQIGRMKGMPSPATMRRWKNENPAFGKQVARARAESAALFREKALNRALELNKIGDKILAGTMFDETGSRVTEIPRGVVEVAKLFIQEMNREAALRDDRNFGDRQRVAVGGDERAIPMQMQVAPMTAEELAAIRDLQIAEREN